MSEPREAFIEKLMAQITRLTMIPKVQVERAIAPILGLFIAELLSTKWSKQVVMICEEFPLRKAQVKGIRTYQSTNIDWLLYIASDDQLVFLELKTAYTSFDPLQKGNCSRPTFGCHAGMGSGLPSRVRRIASMARMQRRRAVSMTDRRSA